MSGISDYSDSVPSIFPQQPPAEVGGTETPPEETPSSPENIDLFLQGDSSAPSYLQLQANGAINLSPSNLSAIEVLKVISAAIQQLREALNESEYLDQDITRQFHLSSLAEANALIESFRAVVDAVQIWNGDLAHRRDQINEAYATLVQKQQEFNSLVEQTTNNDTTQINEVNQYIDIYKNPTSFQNFANSQFGGDTQAALNFINGKIQDYNNYMASRPNLQAKLNEYKAANDNYNAKINLANNDIDAINAERAQKGLPPLDHVNSNPSPNTNINHYVPYEGSMPGSLPTVSLPANSTTINRINVTPSHSTLDTPPPPPNVPSSSYSEALALLWLPEALPTLAFLSSFNRILELGEALRDTETIFDKNLNFDIILPGAYIERAQQIFLDSIGIGGTGGLAMAAFALGLHSRNLEIALSRGILSAIAANASLPISARLFGRLQFTALELLQKSSLVSPLPALKFIASSLGSLTASSPAVYAAISFAIIEQVTGLIEGGVVRALVNAQINRLPFFARVQNSVALTQVVYAERSLQQAVLSGSPGRIREALMQLGNARIQLSRSTRLLNTLGALSIGGLASFARQVSATMSLSILSVALEQFGRSIGLPGIVPQFYAQLAGIPTIEILTAMTAGSRIGDVLDNPISILALKQTLVDTLVLNRGFNSETASLLVNNAINNVILRGGINTISLLQSQLQTEFLAAGFNSFQAQQLAKEATALLQADIGVNFLNASYGLNFDRSVIASSIVNNIYGIDAGLVGVMLSNAVRRSLLMGEYVSASELQNSTPSNLLEIALGASLGRAGDSFETQREFRDAVYNELKAAGFSFKDAIFLANSAAAYGLNGTLIPPYGVSPVQLAALEGAVVNRISNELGISGSQAQSIYSQAQDLALARGPYSSSDQFQTVLKEEVFRSIQQLTGRGDGNIIFEHAVADLANPSVVLGLAGLTEQISSAILGTLRPDLGSRLAQEIKDQILLGLMGGTTVDEIENPEKKNPLSVLNQIGDSILELTKTEEEADMKKTLRKLIQLLESLLTPNAEIGFLMQSLSDCPSTFIGSILGSQQPKGEFLQVQV